jgi:glycosyltransferase involved in cell wall biosynthesis
MKPITQARRTSLTRQSAAVSPQGDGPPPRVSVIIPTHSRAELVPRAIESVLKQTFRDFELIVVDDGSNDNTHDVVAAISDPRLQLIRLPKSGGASCARNAGIASARGEWVAFLDDDDEWLPQLLERQLARLAQAPGASAVYCLRAGQVLDGKIVPSPYKPPLPEGDVLDSVLASGHTISPCAHIVKRSALLEVGGFDETFSEAEDRDLWLRLAQASHHFVAVPETLIIVHMGHRGRLTDDGVGLSQSFAAYERRWGKLARRRLGLGAYNDIELARRLRLEKLHRSHVRRLVRRGRRADAWRYVRAMTPTLRTFPWGTPFVARALSVAVFGRAAERMTRPPGRSAESEAYRGLRAEDGPDDTA